MYYLKKTIEVAGCHHLDLTYSSKCTGLHGHNWLITVYCKAKELDANGMVIDFARLKELVKEPLDHKNLNDVLDFNPTAENIARWIVDRVPGCYRADVQESLNNTAVYIKDGEADIF